MDAQALKITIINEFLKRNYCSCPLLIAIPHVTCICVHTMQD